MSAVRFIATAYFWRCNPFQVCFNIAALAAAALGFPVDVDDVFNLLPS